MDLNDVETVEEGIFLQLKDPSKDYAPAVNSKGEPQGFKVVSIESAAYKSRANIIGNRLKKKTQLDRSVEEDVANSIELVAATIVDFVNLEAGTKKVEYSQKAAVELLTKYGFIYEQVNAFSADRTRFLKASQAN